MALTNNGPNDIPNGVDISDFLPNGFTFVSDNPPGEFNISDMFWPVPSLSAGESRTLEITGTVDLVGEITNTAEISGVFDNISNPDSTPGNHVSTEDDQDSVIVNVQAFLDSDGDGVPDVADNCPNNSNVDQLDTDGDGIGDVCDAATTFVISDSTSCELLPNASWVEPNKCQLDSVFSLGSEDSLAINSGTIFEITGYGTLDSAGTINNLGNFKVSRTLIGGVFVGGTLSNLGTINNSGIFESVGHVVNQGTINILRDTVFNNLPSSDIVNNGTINTAGLFQVSSGVPFSNNGNVVINAPGRLPLSAGGIINNHGAIDNNRGTIDINGILNNFEDGTIDHSGGMVAFGTLNNAGTFNHGSADDSFGDLTIFSVGIINNQEGGIINGYSNINNLGTINNQCGASFSHSGTFLTNPVNEFLCIPTLMQPADGSVVSDPRPLLEWENQDETRPTVTTPTLNTNPQTVPIELVQFSRLSAQPTNDLPDGSYQWYVTVNLNSDFNPGYPFVATPVTSPTLSFDVLAPIPDSDKDTIPDSSDNCIDVRNPDQNDVDGDNIGDVCDVDIDGDGIENNIDPAPTDNSNNTFDDGTTSGIVERKLQTLQISQEGDAIKIASDPTSGEEPATISDCENTKYSITPGDELAIKCGRSIIQIIQGPIEVEFTGTDGTVGTTSLDTGSFVTYESENFALTNDGPTQVQVLVNGQTIVIEPDTSVILHGHITPQLQDALSEKSKEKFQKLADKWDKRIIKLEDQIAKLQSNAEKSEQKGQLDKAQEQRAKAADKQDKVAIFEDLIEVIDVSLGNAIPGTILIDEKTSLFPKSIDDAIKNIIKWESKAAKLEQQAQDQLNKALQEEAKGKQAKADDLRQKAADAQDKADVYNSLAQVLRLSIGFDDILAAQNVGENEDDDMFANEDLENN